MKITDSRKWRPDDPRRLRMAEKRTEILRAARPILRVLSVTVRKWVLLGDRAPMSAR